MRRRAPFRPAPARAARLRVGLALALLLLAIDVVGLPGGAGAAGTEGTRASYTENPACPDAEYNKVAQGVTFEGCGAALGGPGTLHLSPCPNGQGSLLCSEKFTLAVAPVGAQLCPKPSLTARCVVNLGARVVPRQGGKDIQLTTSLVYLGEPVAPLGPAPSLSLPFQLTVAADPEPPARLSVRFFAGGEITVNGSASGRFVGTLEVPVVIGAAPKTEKKALLAVTLAAPKEGLAVGQTASVTATVAAEGGTVSGVSLGPGLTSSTKAVEIVSGQPRARGFTLAKGASRSFVVKVKGVAPGATKLSLDASGTAAGKRLSASADATLKVGKPALAISIAAVAEKTKLTTFPLEVTDKGTIVPRNLTVTVKLANRGPNALDRLSLQSLRPVPVDRTQQLDQLGLPSGALPVSIGRLAAGASVTKTFTLEVTGDGKYELQALALYADPGAARGTGVATATGGEFEATVPALFYTAKRDDDNVADRDGAAFVKAGTPWYVSAKLKNLSSWRSLCVLPMAPRATGNASSAGPIAIAYRDLRSIGGPHAGALAPGRDVALLMVVDTSDTGATLGKVAVMPEAVEIDRGAPCNQQTAKAGKKLGAKDRKIVPGSEGFTVRVDLSTPAPETAGVVTKGLNFFGGFTGTIVIDTFEQLGGVVALANSASSTVEQYGAMGKAFPVQTLGYEATMKAASLVYSATGVYANYWRTATEEEKEDILARTVSVLVRVTGDFYTQAPEVVRESAEPFMDELVKAYATGNDAQVWKLWGKVGGHVGQQVLTLVFAEVLSARIAASGAKLEAVADAATEEWAASEVTEKALRGAIPPEASLKTVPAGAEVTLPQAEALWGQDAASDAAFLKIADEEKVLIGVRGRQIESVEKLKQGSVWKHENLKPKNVSDIDIEWLGFRKADKAEVRFRTYTPEQEAAIRERVAASKLTADQKKAVISRLETRLDEKQYVEKIKGFAKKKEINVGFNYRENGVKRATTQQVRRFSLLDDAIEADGGIPAGGRYYTPLQENLDLYKLRNGLGKLPPSCRRLLATVLCTVTGDMDGVYVVSVNGGAIAPDKMAAIYGKLQKAGWQHPETLTWINSQDEFLFGTKSKILKGLEQGGGEAMIEYAPDGVRRATYLDLDQSVLLDRGRFRLQVVGGYTGEAAPLTVGLPKITPKP